MCAFDTNKQYSPIVYFIFFILQKNWTMVHIWLRWLTNENGQENFWLLQ